MLQRNNIVSKYLPRMAMVNIAVTFSLSASGLLDMISNVLRNKLRICINISIYFYINELAVMDG